MPFNRSSFAKILSLFVVLAMLAAASVLAIRPTLAQHGIDKAEAEEQSARQTPGNPDTSTEPPRDVQGHLGYDKATGKSLPDPTVVENPPSSAADLALSRQQSDEKLARTDATQIRFRSGYEIHPQPGIAPEVLEKISRPAEAAGGDGHYVVQFRYPVPTQARRNLESAGITFYDDLDTGAALAKIPSQALAGLQKLTQDGTVRYVGSIPREARLSPGLADLVAKQPGGSSDIVLLTFDEPTQAQLHELSQWFKVERRSDGPMHILEGKAVHAGLQNMASLDYVRWIEPAVRNELGNLEGGMAMGADIIRQAGFPGTGVTVAVIDTGIAILPTIFGNLYHPDLLASRIVDQYDYQNTDNIANDDNSHGTHVAGSIGGRYNAGNSNSDRPFQGVAPGVNFNIYKLCCGTNQFSSTWFQQALQRGTSGGHVTNISNNSWGGGNGIYNTNSEIADRAVRGEYNGQEINMVIISHNDNALTRAPGTAKNAVTVGSVKDGNYPDVAFTSCSGVNDYDWPPAQRVCYSNFGPLDTDGNGYTRVKPDIMATGAMIRSTVPWYLYGDGRYYTYMDGTSMAAPQVSGAIAQFLDHFPSLLEWPEVVKAFLLATAMNVGNDVNKYGRGLLDAYHMNYYQPGIQNPSLWWGNIINSTAQFLDFTFSVPAGYQEVVVALTWPDPAGATEAINDLDISFVKDGGGTIRGFSASYDDNVEFVRIPSGYAGGTWTVRVYGFSLASAQTFGLAVNPILKKADLSINGTVEYIGPPSYAVNPGNTFYFHQYVSNSGYAAGGTYARLFVPAGFTVEGALIYTADGASHFYDDTEIYHPTGSSYWRAALGATIAGSTRHVRWLIRANSNAACGPRSFESQAYWTQAGVLWGSPTDIDAVKVICRVYLPLILRQ